MISKKQLCGIADEAGASLGQQIRAHRKLGWVQMELRTVGGIPLHKLADSDLRLVEEQILRASIKVPTIATTIGNWASNLAWPVENDIAELIRLIKMGQRLGTSYYRVMSYANDDRPEKEWGIEVRSRMTRLAKIAFENGVKILHENCHGWAASDPRRVRALLNETEGKGFGLLFDVGNPLVHGYDGLAFCREFSAFIEHVHVKDAWSPIAPGNEIFTYPGEGEVPILDCLDTLLKHGYSGSFSIEPHLALLPHREGYWADASAEDSYVRYGKKFESLLGGRLEHS